MRVHGFIRGGFEEPALDKGGLFGSRGARRFLVRTNDNLTRKIGKVLVILVYYM